MKRTRRQKRSEGVVERFLSMCLEEDPSLPTPDRVIGLEDPDEEPAPAPPVAELMRDPHVAEMVKDPPTPV